MAKFKNPWGKGGENWNSDLLKSQAIDDGETNLQNNFQTSNLSTKRAFDLNLLDNSDGEECITILGKIVASNLDDIEIQFRDKKYSTELLDQIFAEVQGLPATRVESNFASCCGAIFGVGVYGLKS